jgi:SAM-dependent methyltransferase
VARGRLICRGRAAHRFPIERGVPVFVQPESGSKEQQRTQRSFSAKWARATDYRAQTGRFYTDWYLQRYGFRTLSGLRRFLSTKRFVLDAGTGTGRDSALYAAHSRAHVFGIDISAGIQTAYRDLKDVANLHLLRADLRRLPFPRACFDFIACDQVLHHTPDPKRSLARLLRHLKPGGDVAFYLYRKKGPVREFCDTYLRRRTTAMSDRECFRFSESMARLGRALSTLKGTVDIREEIPLLGIAPGRYDPQRFFYWNVLKCFWNDQFDFRTNAVINFDWYHPESAYRYSPEEIRRWCRELGLRVRRFNVVEAGISVLATKTS